MERRPALGKGLSALIPDVPESPRTGTLEVDCDLLVPNEQQPRVVLDAAKLEELADSIRTNGIIQPILVRRTGTTYRIIAGERRWRAAGRITQSSRCHSRRS
jgi:ParB family transcriptional regulator, chromosome partitioning protein